MQKVTMTKYIDSEGKQIAYGDILRLKNYQPSDKPYAPKEPYYMVVKYDKTKDLVFCSSMDEFVEVSEFQLDNNDVRLNKLRLLKLDISQDMIKDTLNFFLRIVQLMKFVHIVVRKLNFHLIKGFLNVPNVES